MDNAKYKRVSNLLKIMQETFGITEEEDQSDLLKEQQKFDKYLENESDSGTIINEEQTQKDDISDLFKSTSPGKSGKRVTIRESVNIINELDELVRSEDQSQDTKKY